MRKGLNVWQDGDRYMVQTFAYSYNVSVTGFGNVYRYDSPHNHRPCHHRHAYQWRVPDDPGTLTEITGNAWPTLGEVIGETEQWYWQHYDELPENTTG